MIPMPCPAPKRYVRQMLTFMGKPAHERAWIMREQRRIQQRYSHQLREALARRDGRCCAACGATKDLVIDHVLPVSKGGKTVLKNLQLLCKSCDYEKQDRIMDYRRKSVR